jgi:hypothetical protein
MRILSPHEAATWCQEHHVALSDRGLPEDFDVDLKFRIPRDAQQRVNLVSQAMEAFGDETLFLVWFDNWSVWSGQRMHVFDRLRMSYGETRRLIDSPGHLFDQTEIEDATSFVTVAVLFLWDCYIVVPGRRKLLFLSHDEFGLSKGIKVHNGVQVPSAAAGQVRPRVLPVWSSDHRDPVAGDAIGCPVSVREMVEYLNPLLTFRVLPENLEFIQKGQVDSGSYWLWVFYGEDKRRWNLCVFTGPDPQGGPWMCADNNPYDLNDRDYVIAIYDKQY